METAKQSNEDIYPKENDLTLTQPRVKAVLNMTRRQCHMEITLYQQTRCYSVLYQEIIQPSFVPTASYATSDSAYK